MECMRLSAGDTQIVRCREDVRSSECPLLEVPLYMHDIVHVHVVRTFFRAQTS